MVTVFMMFVVMIMYCSVQHDAQLDYYGRKLATCSSDRTVRIFEIVNNTQNLVATLVGYVDWVSQIVIQ